MEPKEISKKTAIEKIIADDVESILFNNVEGRGYLYELLKYGHEGWFSLTIEKLQAELDNRFDEQYIINPEL